MSHQKRNIKSIIGIILVLAPVAFLFGIFAVYFSIVFTVPKQANDIAYAAGPLVGYVFSSLAWTLLVLVFLGVPSGIILLILGAQEKTAHPSIH